MIVIWADDCVSANEKEEFKKQKNWSEYLADRGMFVDFREPNIIRATPAPLYNSFEDVLALVHNLKAALSDES